MLQRQCIMSKYEGIDVSQELGIVRGLFAGTASLAGWRSGAGVLIGQLQVCADGQKDLVLCPKFLPVNETINVP